ncbi:uncharacterized protein [Phyllobates terribilis]|uniref:uncharacterized protein n=1 Tax=Phyllobates terribilis TaxID=111132 RepID=UPI003CCA6E50
MVPADGGGDGPAPKFPEPSTSQSTISTSLTSASPFPLVEVPALAPFTTTIPPAETTLTPFTPPIPTAETAPPTPDPTPLSQTLFTPLAPLPFLFTFSFVFFTLLSAGGVVIFNEAAPLRLMLQGLTTTPCFSAEHVLAAAAADRCSSLSCRPSPCSCVQFTAGSPADTGGDTHAEDPGGATPSGEGAVQAGITAAITAAPMITGAGVPDFDPASDLHMGDPDTTAHAADDAAPADSAPPTLQGAATAGKCTAEEEFKRPPNQQKNGFTKRRRKFLERRSLSPYSEQISPISDVPCRQTPTPKD